MATPIPHSPFFHEERHRLIRWPTEQIAVCGVGALGGNIAEMLARMGAPRLRLIDQDRVEARNLGTQPYGRGDLGHPKAQALSRALYRAVECRATPSVATITEASAPGLFSACALLVDCLDNTPGRRVIAAYARQRGVPCVHVGFSGDGLYGSMLWEPGYRVPGAAPGDPCDYPLTRPLAITLAAVAAEGIVGYLCGDPAQNIDITWRDLVIHRAAQR